MAPEQQHLLYHPPLPFSPHIFGFALSSKRFFPAEIPRELACQGTTQVRLATRLQPLMLMILNQPFTLCKYMWFMSPELVPQCKTAGCNYLRVPSITWVQPSFRLPNGKHLATRAWEESHCQDWPEAWAQLKHQSGAMLLGILLGP